MNKKLNKKWLFSLFSVPLVALPIGLSTMNNSTNSVSLVSKSLNVNESTTDSSINLTDALPVSDESIKSFGDYIVSYEDNNISPVNVVVPNGSESTDNPKAGGATVGMTKNKQTITLTTYAGLLLWSHKLVDNQLLKQYYSSVKSISNISNYKVINFAYLESKNILFVLFGEETTADTTTTTLSNLVVFGLDINSGSIVVPSTGKLAESQVIAQARDNSAFIFFNSSDQLLITSGNTNNNIADSSKIMSFDESTGFANVKGNDEESNNFAALPISSSSPAVANANDFFLGFLPSSQKGLNYSLWLFSSKTTKGSGTLSYATGTSSPDKSIALNQYFNYYILPLNDDFTVTSNPFTIVNNSGNSRGYLGSAFPEYEDIYKRFFYTGSSEASGTTTESLGILLDSDDDMFSSFANFKYTVSTSGSSPTVASAGINIFMNYNTATLTAPQKADLPTDLASDVDVNNYEFNSVGYDKESNFVYFSLSGAEETGEGDGTTANGKYLTNTRYVDLDSTDANKTVSADKYVEDNPYTLSDVNFKTYSDENNLYLTKQVIDGNDGQWLSTSVADFNDDEKDFTATNDSKIDFSTLDTLANELENSKVLDNVMPSAMKSNLNILDPFLSDKTWNDTVKFTDATGDNETGEINLQTEITYKNNFGDDINDNGSVSYVAYVQTTGFSIKDFSLTFMENTESAVVDMKKEYNAEKIVETNNKAYVINHLLKNFTIKGQKFVPTEEQVTLTNPTTNSLKVEIKIPVKSSPSDENGILPVGFPADNATVSIVYNDFTGTGTPPAEQFPTDPNHPTNNGNNSNGGLSGGAIAGIVIGCLALAAIIIAVIVLVRIRSKSKIAA